MVNKIAALKDKIIGPYKDTLCLAGGYLIGQGGVFVVQCIIKAENKFEFLGVVVMMVSLLSFCFQFGDIGNVAYILKKLNLNKEASASKFLGARVLVSIILSIGFSVWTASESQNILPEPVFFMLPLIGGVFAASNLSKYEFFGKYEWVSLINAVPWVLISFVSLMFLMVGFFEDGYSIVLATTLFCFMLGLYVFLLKKNRIIKTTFVSLKNGMIAELILVLGFVLPQLGGQIWGRKVMFEVYQNLGLSELGEFGVVRYLQIALVLILGFLSRPMFRNYVRNHEISYSLKSAYVYCKLPINISIAIGIVVIGVEALGGFVFSYWLYWYFLLILIPVGVVAQLSTQVAQLKFGPNKTMWQDLLALVGNVVFFYLVLKKNIMLAVVAGEVSSLLIKLIIYKVMVKYSNEKF